MADGGSRRITFAGILIGTLYLLSYCSGCPPPQPASMFIHESKTVYLVSPMDPSGLVYPPNTDCRWMLQTHEDNVITIKSNMIYLEGRPNHCKSYDYLMIFDGKDMYDDILGEFCGNVSVNVKSTENFAFVLFKSDQYEQRRGFRLEISSVPKPAKDRPKEKKPNLHAIIGGVIGGVVCSVLFVTFACCCLHTKRCPCRRGNHTNRTVSPHGSRITVQPASTRDRHVPLVRTDSSEPSVSTISSTPYPYLYFNPRPPAAFERPETMRMSVLSPPPYISGPPPPLESSNSSNSSSSPPPPYMEQDPHPHAVQSDSVPSYSSR